MSQTTLGKYQIIREIARSNDIVYEAYDPVMNRRVALKELAMPGGASQQQKDDRIKRFLREAKAAGSLAHPNIVTIYEVGEDAGRRYIAMEYLDGQNLRNLLDTKGFIEPKKAVEVTIEVLKGLEYAHSHGVIHRDIKPDNIQLLENGEIKITDFGIARLTFEPNLTMDGQVFGTPSYMSPEQINGRDIDARSDIFSVGVILYEMVAGQKPFQGDSVVSITYAIMNSEPTQPSQCGPGLWQVVRQALDKSPQLRWGSAKEMGAALGNSLNQMVSGSVVVDPYAPSSPHLPQYPTLGPINPGPPPVQVSPSNPYGSAYTPYGTPMPGTVSQQPYQPYGQAPPPVQQQPYGQPYGQPYNALPPGNYAPAPVYYPPPPRGPVVSPETRSFFGRLVKAFLLVGTILALVVVGILQLSKTLDGQGVKTSPGRPPAAAATGEAQSVPADTSVPPAPSVTRDNAIDFMRQAMDEVDPSERRRLWSRATAVFIDLGQKGDTAAVHTDAVRLYLEAADALIERREHERAAEALYEARGFQQADRQLGDEINLRLQFLGR